MAMLVACACGRRRCCFPLVSNLGQELFAHPSGGAIHRAIESPGFSVWSLPPRQEESRKRMPLKFDPAKHIISATAPIFSKILQIPHSRSPRRFQWPRTSHRTAHGLRLNTKGEQHTSLPQHQKPMTTLKILAHNPPATNCAPSRKETSLRLDWSTTISPNKIHRQWLDF